MSLQVNSSWAMCFRARAPRGSTAFMVEFREPGATGARDQTVQGGGGGPLSVVKAVTLCGTRLFLFPWRSGTTHEGCATIQGRQCLSPDQSLYHYFRGSLHEPDAPCGGGAASYPVRARCYRRICHLAPASTPDPSKPSAPPCCPHIPQRDSVLHRSRALYTPHSRTACTTTTAVARSPPVSRPGRWSVAAHALGRT